MDKVSIDAIIFMGLGWAFVLALVIYSMTKILTDKTEYEDKDDNAE